MSRARRRQARYGRRRWTALAVLGLAVMGCRQDMHDQPKLQPLEASSFFANGMASRHPPAGTVARDQLHENTRLWQGKDENGNLLDGLPESIVLTRELLEHGRTRFEIYCSVCHDSTGGGRGMIVRRGFKQPPPLYEQRLRDLPDGYFFDVMTTGFGLMSSYAKQIPMEDRWAIVAYLRALQLSQAAVASELPAAIREEMHQAMAAAPAGEGQAEGHHD